MGILRKLGLILSFFLIMTGCNAMNDTTNPSITLTTNKGDIVIELFQDKAPKTVENVLTYVKDGYYDGTIFHRVIPGFMIQGGGFTAEMDQKPTGAPVENEANNGVTNDVGTVAMARTPDPHSATAQFFINVKDNDFLNFSSPTSQGWGYCVFGKVTAGLDVVEAIEGVATGSRMGHQDVPKDAVVIEKVVINE